MNMKKPVAPVPLEADHRPYDPFVLERITRAKIEGEARTEEPAPQPAEFLAESVPSESSMAVGGLRRFFSPEAREQRRAARSEDDIDSSEVIRWVANRIVNPRRTSNPAEKIGWVGTDRLDEGDRPRPEQRGSLGRELFRKQYESSRPNPYRPVTFIERTASARLDRLWHKRNVARNLRNWILDSHATVLPYGNGHRLSLAERHGVAAVRRKISRLDKRIARAERNFNRTARGTYLQARSAGLGAEVPDSGQHEPDQNIRTEAEPPTTDTTEAPVVKVSPPPTEPPASPERKGAGIDPWKTALKYVADLREKYGVIGMSPESLTTLLEKQGLDESEAQKTAHDIHSRMQREGIVTRKPGNRSWVVQRKPEEIRSRIKQK
jgi:hypothetical protein